MLRVLSLSRASRCKGVRKSAVGRQPGLAAVSHQTGSGLLLRDPQVPRAAGIQAGSESSNSAPQPNA